MEYRHHLREELAVVQVQFIMEQCKKTVTYVKKSTLFPNLEKRLHQEIDVRWNYHKVMLQSIHCQYDEVKIVENVKSLILEQCLCVSVSPPFFFLRLFKFYEKVVGTF